MKNELNEKDLAQVSGGIHGEGQVSVGIELPSDMGNITIKVYIDGEIDLSRTNTVDTNYITYRTFVFCGSGIKHVRFKINNENYCSYEIDFDNGTATRIS